ncbi:MAG: inositol monophosphatase [Deltaproteobacteria bacterium]|nr:inositol monophosphatase [Deltaproteobacteria bacterium]
MDYEPILKTAFQAAHEAGDVLRSYHGHLTGIRKKAANDLVTEADVASEEVIIEAIRTDFPGHGILAEESGEMVMDSPFSWIIDPLDGTTNYAHGLSTYAVSIAVAHKGETVVGVVFNPDSGEMFSAVKNGGAMLNALSIAVSVEPLVSESLLVTGFPYDFKAHIMPLITRFQQCLSAARAVRRFGSAAIDLCYVACGRFDGFWEQNLNPWDTAAGELIVREAGGMVTDFSNRPFQMQMKEILATNGKIHQQMQSLLSL